jgi:hypothetical protein
VRIPGEAFEHYRRYRVLAQTLDSAVRVPGTQLGVGLDFLLGLVPGVGDLAAGALGAYGLWVAQKLGAPRSVLLRMAGNIAVDTVVGSVPLLGDLFDLGFRSNLRNLALLDRWIDAPARTRRSSRALVFGLGAALLATTAGALWAIAALVGGVWRLATGG